MAGEMADSLIVIHRIILGFNPASTTKSDRKHERSINPQPTARKSLFCTQVVLSIATIRTSLDLSSMAFLKCRVETQRGTKATEGLLVGLNLNRCSQGLDRLPFFELQRTTSPRCMQYRDGVLLHFDPVEKYTMGQIHLRLGPTCHRRC